MLPTAEMINNEQSTRKPKEVNREKKYARQAGTDLTYLPLPWFLTLLLICMTAGCGGQQAKQAKLEWQDSDEVKPRVTKSESELAPIYELIKKRAISAAETRLKEVSVSKIPRRDKPLYAFLTARIRYANDRNRGCKMLSEFALQQAQVDPQLRLEASHIATTCLDPPNGCSSLSALLTPQLESFPKGVSDGLYDRWARCDNAQPLIRKILSSAPKIDERTNNLESLVRLLGRHQPLNNLVLIRKGAAELSWIASISSAAIIERFGSELTERQQHKLVSTLPATHVVRQTWAKELHDAKVLFCLPLSGSFGEIGNLIQSQLSKLQTTMSVNLADQMEFLDCSQTQWNESDYIQTLKERRPIFVVSATSPQIQDKLIGLHEDPGAPYHITLNPLAGNDQAKRSWSLYLSPDIFVGTLLRDALSRLNRSESQPMPLNILMITDADQPKAVGQLLRAYRKGFANFREVAIPKRCPEGNSFKRKQCLSERTEVWQQLVGEIETINRSSSPNDLIYFDIAPRQIVMTLKYLASERANQKNVSNHRPLLYADGSSLQEPEAELSVDKETNHPSGQRWRFQNRFARLAGEYAEGMTFLVHFDPTAAPLRAFSTQAESVLDDTMHPDVLRIVEALGLMEAMLKVSRKELRLIGALRKDGISHKALSAGVSLESASPYLPRLRTMTLQKGYFVRQ